MYLSHYGSSSPAIAGASGTKANAAANFSALARWPLQKQVGCDDLHSKPAAGSKVPYPE
jgi:hypothetical protein